MALLTDNEVQLRISARAEGGAGVDALAVSVDDLQKELDAVAESAKNSGTAQAEAANKLAAAKTKMDDVKLSLMSAKNEYKFLADRAKEAGAGQSIFAEQAANAKNRVASLNTELIVSRGNVRLAGEEHRNAASQTKTHAYEQQRLTENLRAVTAESGRTSQANIKVSDSVRSISAQLTEVKTLYAAWIGLQAAGSAVSGVVKTADAYANLTARVKMAVGEGEAFQLAFQGIQDIALRTNSSLDTTGNLFIKLAESGKQMGVGQAEALRLTETVNQAIQLSGGSAQSASAGVTQLIQALQSGVLRGDEFNSIMENSPRLAKALADGLGVTTGELRKMAEAGQLSSQVVIGALRGQAAAIEGEFGKLPLTIGRAITDLSTQWQIWLGTLDQSTGASRSAAGAIEMLAKNFDLVASGLINAGQAYIGWKAYNIAAEFLSLKTAVAASAAAKTLDTAATVANTTATATNTAAQVANNAAKSGAATAATGAAAGVGRLASALSLIKGFSLAFLVTNLVDIGQWMGEAAAKAMGYGKVMADNELKIRAGEAASKAMANAEAELAQKTQMAAEQALGLSGRSKQLVADFDELAKKGDTASTALAKIAKSLDVSDIKGIAETGAALDALAVKGKISADQVREAWRLALDGQDLQKFEVQAIAAFDGSAQGAGRLAAALDAQLGEALRRTGLDANALSNGVNEAAQKAINDFDVLSGRVDQLKAKGVDAGIALAASLDQSAKAATTEAAARLVLTRWEELGKSGLVTGDRLADGLNKARASVDRLTPGVNSIAEAFQALGMKSPEELNKVAASAATAFNAIKQGSGYTQAELANLREAFRRYAEASIAANGGVASDAIRAQSGLYGLKVEVDETGKAMLRVANSAGGASSGIRAVGDSASSSRGAVEEYTASLQRMAAAQAAADAAPVKGADGISRNAAGQHVDGKTGEVITDVNGNPVTNSTSILDDRAMRNRTAPVDVESLMYKRNPTATVNEVKAAAKYYSELYARGAATQLTGNLGNADNAARLTNQVANQAMDKALELARRELATGQAIDLGTSVSDLAKRNIATTNWQNQVTTSGGEAAIRNAYKNAGNAANEQTNKALTTVNINLNGQRNQLTMDEQSASSLAGIFKKLESDAARSF